MAKRKIYEIGSRLNLKIPAYVSKEVIDWLNKQPSITNAIFGEIEKIAKGEYIEVYKINEYLKNNLNNILLQALIEEDIKNQNNPLRNLLQQKANHIQNPIQLENKKQIIEQEKLEKNINENKINIESTNNQNIINKKYQQNVEIKEEINNKEIVKEIDVNINNNKDINNINTDNNKDISNTNIDNNKEVKKEEKTNTINNKTDLLSKYARNAGKFGRKRNALKAKKENKKELFVDFSN